MNRPITTLFLIQSLDGKISTGDVDERDVDKDFKHIDGIKEGLPQYYKLEQQTDSVSLNSGKVMAKIGVNERKEEPTKIDVDFVIIDNKPHLAEKGVEYLAKWVNYLYLVTTDKNHPAFRVKERYPNIHIIWYPEKVDLSGLLRKLKEEHQVNRITIQSGGTLNAQWIRLGLIDHVSIVIAPALIGGTNTQSLMGGESLHTQQDLAKIKSLVLKECDILEDSYIHVKYDVIN